MDKLDENKDFIPRNPCDEARGCSDPLFEQVVKWVQDIGYASISGLQRDFGIGYSRASRLIEQLEAAGIIGPEDGVKPRKVLTSMHIL